jgi:sugar-specific transcriptional regulator TrmB
MPTPDHTALLKIGLTELEAEIYVFMLGESPVTGYRVAQALGRPAGNVYKSLEALQTKGAILAASQGDNRVYRAVGVDEFLRRAEGEFRKASGKARRSLRLLTEPPPDNRVYELVNGPQVIERCRRMLRNAKTFVLLTLCPAPVRELKDELAAAAARGVLVAVKVFEPADVPGVQVIVDPRGVSAVNSGPGQWLFATADGASMLQALMSGEDESLLEAFYTCNPLLTWSAYTGLCSDLMLAAIRPGILRGESNDKLASQMAELAKLEFPHSIGKAALMHRYRGGKESPRARRARVQVKSAARRR